MKTLYKISFLILIVFSVTSCRKKDDGSELNDAITWEYYSGSVRYTDPKVQEALSEIELDDQCKVDIKLLFPRTDSEKYEPLRQELHDFLLDRFVADGHEILNLKADDPQAFVNSFVDYQISMFKEEISEISSIYLEGDHTPFSLLVKEFYLSDSLLYNKNGIVSIGLNNYEYSGGAHGTSIFSCRSYDLKNHSPISPSTLFQDPKAQGILDAIEDQILADYGVESIKELQESNGIFSLTGSEVVMSNEFYFSEKGITFYYNPYEIAAYAYGSTEVTVPYSVLAPYFRSQYQFLGKL